jgi:hypothetical protein
VSKPGSRKGGKRPGAGRPKGSRNALERGEVQALKALRRRVPKDAEPGDVALADEARDVILQAMRGGIHWQECPPRLKAATWVREEVCGPRPTKIEASGPDGEPLIININTGRKR